MTPILTQWRSRMAPRITPGVAEVLLTVLALLFLLWQAQVFRSEAFLKSGGERYRADQARAVALPTASRQEPRAAACALPRATVAREDWTGRVCALLPDRLAHAVAACKPKSWQEDLCWKVAPGAAESVDQAITTQLQAVQEHLAAPLRADSQAQEKERLLARAGLRPVAPPDGDDELDDEDTAADTSDGEYRRAYGLEQRGMGAAAIFTSRPLACAMDWLADNAKVLGETNSRLLSAAVLGGWSAPVRKWTKQDVRKLPGFSASSAQRCADLGAPVLVVNQAASLMAKAHASRDTARKGAAAEALLQRAGWILAGYAMLGLLLLKIGRRPVPLLRFIAFGLMLWGLLGWVSGVQLPDGAPAHWRDSFFPVMAGAAGMLWLLFSLLPVARWGWELRMPRQTLASRPGYAGFVLLVGLGWLLLLDLSAHGHLKNRFLALNQQAFLFSAFVLISLLPALRLGLARAVGRLYAVLLTAQSPGSVKGWRGALPWLLPTLLVLVPLVTVLQHHRQFTSELLRLWFILGVSWFMFTRGERVAQVTVGASHRSLLLPLLLPLALITLLLVLGQMATDDQGPLLVTLYGSGVLAGGFASLLLEESGRRPRLALPVGMLVTLGWIVAVTLALFTLGPLHETTKARLESLQDPYSAANDQMAIIHDFRAAIPPGGYGLGETPWCGEQAGGGCSGIPLQVQSDYTFTALQGVWGPFWAGVVLLLMFYWLSHLLRYHERVTCGRPDFSSPYAWSQAWTSWISVCWAGLLLAQVVVTVAGNLGWLPLSGVTLPFVSFGAWSLLANSFFLALTLNLMLPEKSS